jgi:hypothetical protein
MSMIRAVFFPFVAGSSQRKQRSRNHLEDSAAIVRVVVSAEALPEMRFREFKEDPPEYGMAIPPICFVLRCFVG